MPRKAKSDSIKAAVEAMTNAAAPLPEMPSHVRMREKDMPFLNAILRTRTREEWLEGDLPVAGQLARCQADIESESLALEDEGSVVKNDRGTNVMNPRHSVLQQLAQREMALMRCLAMGGTTVRGDKRTLGGARQLQAQAEKARAQVAEEDLLA